GRGWRGGPGPSAARAPVGGRLHLRHQAGAIPPVGRQAGGRVDPAHHGSAGAGGRGGRLVAARGPLAGRALPAGPRFPDHGGNMSTLEARRPWWWTAPNLVTLSRLALVPVLLVLARAGASRAFLALFCASLITDIVDGKLARWLGQASEKGA